MFGWVNWAINLALASSSRDHQTNVNPKILPAIVTLARSNLISVNSHLAPTRYLQPSNSSPRESKGVGSESRSLNCIFRQSCHARTDPFATLSVLVKPFALWRTPCSQNPFRRAKRVCGDRANRGRQPDGHVAKVSQTGTIGGGGRRKSRRIWRCRKVNEARIDHWRWGDDQWIHAINKNGKPQRRQRSPSTIPKIPSNRQLQPVV